MKIKQSLFAVALAFSANSAQSTPITAPSLNIPGGSYVNAVWRAPTNQYYKVFVLVPRHATTANALYHVYPKGKRPHSTECTTTDFNYPCHEVAVNQALNQNKWVQLKVNNNPDTAWDFIGGKGYVTVASNALSSTENLGVAGLRFEPSYSLQFAAEWSRAIASVSAIKLVISECLNDNEGKYTLCDSTSELEQFLVSAMPLGAEVPHIVLKDSDSIIPLTAAIQIVGDEKLGGCTFQLQPTINLTTWLITWRTKATAATSGSVADCAKYVTNAYY
jgi:hypothetical protein